MKKLLKVTASTGVLTMLRMAAGFLIAKLVAVYAGPAGMAQLGQVQNFVSSLNALVSAPVSNGVVKFTAEHAKDGVPACSAFWSAGLMISVLFYLISAPLIYVYADSISTWLFQSSAYRPVVYLTLAAMPFSCLGTLCYSIINGFQEFKKYIWLGMVSVIGSCIVMVLMLVWRHIHGALEAIAIQNGLTGGLILLLSCKAEWCRISNFFSRFSRVQCMGIMGFVLMTLTSSLCMPLSLLGVRNILTAEVGWMQAGEWQAVWKISEVYLAVITMALSAYYLPTLSMQKNIQAMKQEVWHTGKVILPLVIVLAVMVYAARDLLISILFTQQFTAARDLFAIQLCGDVVKIISWLVAYPMLATNAVPLFIVTEILFSVSLVGMTHVLVAAHGVSGANDAYLYNYVVYLTVVGFFLHKNYFRNALHDGK